MFGIYNDKFYEGRKKERGKEKKKGKRDGQEGGGRKETK